MKKNILLFFILVLLTSCLTIWRDEEFVDESGQTEFAVTQYKSIFNSYKWTTPPIGSQKLNFNKEGDGFIAEFEFAEKTMKVKKNEKGLLALDTGDNDLVYISSKQSKNDVYFDLNVLGTKLVPVQRLVTKTRYVQKSVQVSRTVPVTKTRMVTSTGPDGSMSTRTETYTDYETRWETEMRTVPETYTDWETVWENHVDIPVYEYFQLPYKPAHDIYVFNVNGQYFLQNPSFYTMTMTEESFFGGEQDINIIMLDSNSNGIYFENTDNLLVIVWNPYDRASEYRETTRFMDNYWYNYNELSEERFISFQLSNDKKMIQMLNANQPYVGSRKKGTIIINNLDYDNGWVEVNGHEYWPNYKGVFKRSIQYGIYKVIVQEKMKNPDEITVVINEENPVFEYTYEPTGEAGQLAFQSDTLRNWSLIIEFADGTKKAFYNRDIINLPAGNHILTIISGGSRISRDIEIVKNETLEINYQQEVNRLAGE